MKSNLDADLDIHGSSVFHRRLKSPLLDRLNGLGVEAVAQTAYYLDVPRMPLVVNNEPENTGTLCFGQAGLFRVLRIGRGNRLGG